MTTKEGILSDEQVDKIRNKELRSEKLKAALQLSASPDGNQFAGLTGKTLRKLIDEGGVVLQSPEAPFEYGRELFKGVNEQKALAYLEGNPRSTAAGWVDWDDATI